ncbi:sugar transporter ERD6-like 14 isoform X1 [Ostrinia furnacalis]|uniref:sugar transporter ERD6-like 14 isoform X1 n=2 Tax=Ostrinia furnacalis TaxID=93504 RepID=UPI00103ED4CB|nr:sugar transporter ERD6-like 14 isoform X1 [Ostrinia furnacalis]
MTHCAVKRLIKNAGIKKTSLFRQVWHMSAVFFSILSTGMLQYPTPQTLRTEDNNNTSLLGYYSIATVAGTVASSILMDQVGRRLTFILGTLPGIFSCITIAFPDASRVNTIRATLSGLLSGYTVILGTVIISEYTSPKYRAVFLNLITASMNIGTTVGHILRPNYQILWTALFLKILSFGICMTWPESPYWLALKDHEENTTGDHNLIFIEGRKELKTTSKNALMKIRNNLTIGMVVNIIKKYSSKEFLRPITVVVFGIILMESSGKNWAPASLIETTTMLKVNYNTHQINSSIIISVMSIVALFFVPILGHRTQLLITGCLSAATLLLTSVCVFLMNNNYVGVKNTWLSSLFILQLMFSNSGSTSIPLALIGEVFHMHFKAAGTLLSGVLISVSSLLVIKSTPYLLSVVHLEGVLIIFATIMIVSLLVMYVILPETKNKTLSEIENCFSNCSNENQRYDRELQFIVNRKAKIPFL